MEGGWTLFWATGLPEAWLWSRTGQGPVAQEGRGEENRGRAKEDPNGGREDFGPAI